MRPLRYKRNLCRFVTTLTFITDRSETRQFNFSPDGIVPSNCGTHRRSICMIVWNLITRANIDLVMKQNATNSVHGRIGDWLTMLRKGERERGREGERETDRQTDRDRDRDRETERQREREGERERKKEREREKRKREWFVCGQIFDPS